MNDAEFAALERDVCCDDPEVVERAHARAVAAMAKEPRCRLLAAIGYDRKRAFAGRPQKFGTQAVLRYGQRQLWPVDRTTSDSERAKWGVPGLARLAASVDDATLVEKQALRLLLRTRRERFDDAAVAERAQAIARHGVGLAAERLADAGAVVAAYWPLPGEADPRRLARAWVSEHGAALALPVVAGQDLVFRRWRDGEALEPAGFGTFAPGPHAPVVTPTVILVPLLGFDDAGGRLGQGKGYYDRYLAGVDGPLAVGIAHSEQRLPAVPTEAHDQVLPFVISEAGVVRCGTA